MGKEVIVTVGVVVMAATFIILLTWLRSRPGNANRSGVRPGYRDVIVRDAVDVSTQVYLSSNGDYFPDEGMKQKTVPLGESARKRWQIVFYNVRNGQQSRISFSGEMLIGRLESTKGRKTILVVDDEKVSKEHCRISASGKSIYVQDLESKNGTLLNGKSIEGKTALHSGDSLCVGDTEFKVQLLRG